MNKLLLILISFLLFSVANSAPPLFTSKERFHPIVAKNGMVVSQEAIATEVALDILKKGGNSFDAAVACAYTLAVTLPKAGNLGGGGFMLVYSAKSKQVRAIDFRERAPLKATRNMYLDNGEVVKNRSRFTPLAIGVPGTVAGLEYLHKQYGTLPLRTLLEPAIQLAERGFPMSAALDDDLRRFEKSLKKNPELRKIFYKANGQAYQLGQNFKRPDLAKTLNTMLQKGPRDFYEGSIARGIAKFMKDNHGLISLEDLKSYRVVDTEAVTGTFHDFQIASMPPPSSGGVHLIQMLNVLEGLKLIKLKHNSATYIHTLAETMKYAYADRSKHLGDPQFHNVPVAALTSKKYARELRARLSDFKATASKSISPVKIQHSESEETTHFSIIDHRGNAVSLTYTLNFSYGSRLVVPGTGIILNNEMDDFSAKPGTPNAYGLIGGKANAIQPGKRPLSSMTPTIILKNGRPVLLTGSPGGSKIITSVLQTILNVTVFDMNIAEATAQPRFHHQWLPDTLFYEQGISSDTLSLLESRGYTLKQSNAMGSTQSIQIKNGRYYGAADPRRPGALAKGY